MVIDTHRNVASRRHFALRPPLRPRPALMRTRMDYGHNIIHINDMIVGQGIPRGMSNDTLNIRMMEFDTTYEPAALSFLASPALE